ncbi:MAG: CotH kinase family protein [Eubacteriales bacterium]|nr:CotH kinase family protein [Eubacteriales bacterium]
MRAKRLALLTCLCLLLCAAPALADGFREDLYVERDGQRVLLYEKSKRCVLFLPSGWGGETLTFRFPDQELSAAGKALQSGAETALFAPGGTVALQNARGKTVYTVEVMEGSGIPSVLISTESGSMKALDASKANHEAGVFTLCDERGEPLCAVPIAAMRGRGNSSYSRKIPKKSYQVKLAKKTDLLGMGEAKVYNLQAEYLDLSLMRTHISLDLARQAGVPCALDCRSVNAWFNGCYGGVYLLTEKVQIQENRVNIRDLEEETEALNELDLKEYPLVKRDAANGAHIFAFDIPTDPEDITGGYLLELQGAGRFSHKESGFITGDGMCVRVTEPDEVSPAQAEYICGIFSAFHRAILAEDGVDAQTGKRWNELFDADSLAKVLVLEEIAKNYDYEKNSLYFFKDAGDGPVYAGPVWDFDRAYGNVAAEFWVNSSSIALYEGREKRWTFYGNLFNRQADFAALAKAVYRELYAPALGILLGEREPDGPLRSLQSYHDEIAPSADMNFTRWNSFAVTGIYKHSGRTFEQSYRYLADFLQKRRAALDENWR